MKTTLDITDELFVRAKDVAQQDGIPFRILVEEGLRASLERRTRKASYTWPDLSVGGEGLDPRLEAGGWERQRDLIYEGRGA